MESETKKVLKYIGVIIISVVVFFFLIAGESIIDNILKNSL